jgi:hypothetical protein
MTINCPEGFVMEYYIEDQEGNEIRGQEVVEILKFWYGNRYLEILDYYEPNCFGEVVTINNGLTVCR